VPFDLYGKPLELITSVFFHLPDVKHNPGAADWH